MKKVYKLSVIVIGIGVIIGGLYLWQQDGFRISLKHGEDSAAYFGNAVYLVILGLALVIYGIFL